MEMLRVDRLKKYFATQKAVDTISFSLEKGSIFGLLGPNGAGKTTLIRMITGIFYPDEGSIHLEGHPFDPTRDIRSIGYMPEERGLYKKMKIGEQALYLAQLKGLSRQVAQKRIHEWFSRLGMEGWWNKKVEDLSKGMGQKLQFVITVLHEPSLIILDEPFSGLDPVNANLIKEEIYRLAAAGSTVIFSTHRMEQVEEICNHIILVNKGKKILDGSVHSVKQQFKENLFRIGLQESGIGTKREPMEPGKERMTQLFTTTEDKEDGLVLQLREGVTPNEVLAYFIEQGRGITSFNEILPSLNDIFIRLVEKNNL